MTDPTNKDLAEALRLISNDLPLGTALIVRLAADRLSEGDGWIEWGGGSAPNMDLNIPVAVRFRDGTEDHEETIEYWYENHDPDNNWVHDGSSADIIAYRIVK